MNEQPTNLQAMLRAKRNTVPAEDSNLTTLIAVTNDAYLDELEGIGFTPSSDVELRRRLMHSTDSADLTVNEIRQVALDVYQELQDHLAGWTKVYLDATAPSLAKAKSDLAACEPLKQHVTRLTPGNQERYWTAVRLTAFLSSRLGRLFSTQVNNMQMAVASLLAIVAAYKESPQLVKSAHDALLAAAKSFYEVRSMLDFDWAELETAHSAALECLTDVATKTPHSAEEDDVLYAADTRGDRTTSYWDDDESYQPGLSYPAVNPTTGLPMSGNTGVDVAGNVFGTGYPGET